MVTYHLTQHDMTYQKLRVDWSTLKKVTERTACWLLESEVWVQNEGLVVSSFLSMAVHVLRYHWHQIMQSSYQ